MRITDMISITELSRLLKKSRPTVYKYVSDYESGNRGSIPHSVKKLFEKIASGTIPKKEIYEYCNRWFVGGDSSVLLSSVKNDKSPNLKDIIKLLKTHERKLDFAKIKKYIEKI